MQQSLARTLTNKDLVLLHRPFSVPFYPLTPWLFILAAAAIVLNTFIAQPGRAALGLAVVLLGAPAYFLWKFRHDK